VVWPETPRYSPREDIVRNIKEEIENARAKVAHYRIRAERPGSRLEDDFALEKARNRLLTLELRQMKLDDGSRQNPRNVPTGAGRGNSEWSSRRTRVGTKRERGAMSHRERAEALFAPRQKTGPDTGGTE